MQGLSRHLVVTVTTATLLASTGFLAGCGGGSAPTIRSTAEQVGDAPPPLTPEQEASLVDADLAAKVTRANPPFATGQCTWYADKRAAETGWNLQFSKNSGRDAKNWWEMVTNANRGQDPRGGAILVLDGGSGLPPQGHVGYVESANGSNFTITHANFSQQRVVRTLDKVSIYEATFVKVNGGVRLSNGRTVYKLKGFLYRQ